MSTLRPIPPPSWASGAFYEREIEAPPPKPSAFELLTEELGLSRAPLWMWAENPAIRQWVKSHKNSKYVPEDLLAALGAHVCTEDWQ
jgi:hypothetical protein